MFTNELARRLEGTGVTATSLHPGAVRTNFGAED
jgi:retinol dehydrogenase-14